MIIPDFKDNPVLEGEEAARFLEKMEHVQPAPAEEIARAKHVYEVLMRNSNLPNW